MSAPGLSRLTSFRNARARSDGATCIQTAPSRITSNARPVLTVRRRAGGESASHRGRLAMTVDGAGRPPIESRALCRALFDVYLGEDPIEPDGRRNFIAGFAGLLQPAGR